MRKNNSPVFENANNISIKIGMAKSWEIHVFIYNKRAANLPHRKGYKQ